MVPRIASLLSKDGTDSRELEPFELAIWERIYGTLAVADREASIILHAILQSVHPTGPTKANHDPSLALMQPLSPEKTRETIDILTPEMHAMIVEANIKNHPDGLIQAAWKSALEEELPRTPNSLLLDEIEPEENTEKRSLGIGSASRSRSGSPTLRREVLSVDHSPGRNSSGPSAGDL